MSMVSMGCARCGRGPAVGLTLFLGLCFAVGGGCRREPRRDEGDAKGVSAKGTPDQARRRARAGEAVALILGPDEKGRQQLFQVPSRPGAPAAVLPPGPGVVASAVASEGGTAVAALLLGEARAATLFWLGASTGWAWKAVPVPGATLRALKAISPDGRTLVAEGPSGDLAVVRVTAGQGVVTPIRLPSPGRPMYGVAVSGDGLKVAFGAMRRDCATGRAAQLRCPVSLYGLELPSEEGRARLLVPGSAPGEVSYNPQFDGAGGKLLLFTTTRGDASEACQADVNRCAYAVHRMPFRGGPSTLVATDAVLFHRARDGALSFRRLAPPSASGYRWHRSSLHVAEPGKAPRQIVGERLALRVHWFSPGGRHLLITTEGGAEGRAVEIVAREDGRGVRPPIPGVEAQAVGWAARPLPTADGRLALPRGLRNLRWAHRLAMARAGGAAADRVAWLGVPRERLLGVHDGARVLADRAAALSWISGRPDAVLVASRGAYCALAPEAERRKLPLVVTGTAGAASAVAEPALALVVVERAARSDPPSGGGARPVRTPDGARPQGGAAPPGPPGLATFRFPSGPGEVVLERADLPAEARAGGRLEVALHFRVVQPPPPGWQVFVHLDGPGQRILGDHPPAICGSAGWRPGQRVVDRFDLEVRSTTGVTPAGGYTLFLGWFQGPLRAATSHPDSRDGRAPVGRLRILP